MQVVNQRAEAFYAKPDDVLRQARAPAARLSRRRRAAGPGQPPPAAPCPIPLL